MKTVFSLLFVFSLLPASFARDNSDRLPEVLAKAGPGKVVVFDLDDTLFAVAPRNLHVIQDFAKDENTPDEFAPLTDRITNELKLSHVGYTLEGTLGALDITEKKDAKFLAAAKAYWLSHFFTSAAVEWDVPNPGALELVRDFYDRGATIVYLTGRSKKMETGSRKTLRVRGFPIEEGDPRVDLILKEDPSLDDPTFKAKARDRIKAHGEVIAAFDNEPGNVLAMRDEWGIPSARVFFVNTAWGGKKMDEVVKRGDILWLKDFRLPK